MTLLTVPKEFNNTVNNAAELAEVVKGNFASYPNITLPIQGLDYKTFAFNRGLQNKLATTTKISSATLPVSNSSFLDIADGFSINRLNSKGEVEEVFKFSLLPAIESTINGKQVPEIKPGILERSSVNIKTFELPGGIPAFQVLGLKPSMLQLVGLLIGSEEVIGVDSSESLALDIKTSKGVAPLYTHESSLNAYATANYFKQQFVHKAKPVKLIITSNNANSKSKYADPTMQIEYKAILQNLRYFIARQDRVYYSIDALILNY